MEYILERTQIVPVSIQDAFGFFSEARNLEERSFGDEQISGPYPLWEHTHRFSPVDDGTEIYDHVRYRVPGGLLAPVVQRPFVGRWLDEIFDYRAERLREILG
jgi:ligand-binding SRPBCC domain-containing protein